MVRRDLVAQIDHEIVLAEKSLTFWTTQLELQMHTEFEDSLRVLVRMHETALEELNTARKALIDA